MGTMVRAYVHSCSEAGESQLLHRWLGLSIHVGMVTQRCHRMRCIVFVSDWETYLRERISIRGARANSSSLAAHYLPSEQLAAFSKLWAQLSLKRTTRRREGHSRGEVMLEYAEPSGGYVPNFALPSCAQQQPFRHFFPQVLFLSLLENKLILHPDKRALDCGKNSAQRKELCAT